MKPSSFPLGMDIESPMERDVSQVQPPIVGCPTGTIPILRNHRRDHIATHSIDEMTEPNNQQEVSLQICIYVSIK
jgi:hypothetical protein